MIIKCRKCGKEFEKASHRNQHEKDAHKTSYADGEPCGHLGCLNHVSHPCEGCGRIAGRQVPN